MLRQRRPALIFGVHPVLEKLRHAPAEVSEIIVSQGPVRGPLESIIEGARQSGIALRRLPRAALDQMAQSSKHQGVIARVHDYDFYPFTDLVREVSGSQRRVRVLAVDGVTDPRNLGALLRTAEGAGVCHVVVPAHRAAGMTPAVAKGSAGAINYLKISRVTNLHRALVTLKKEGGLWVVGLDVGAEPLFEKSYPEKLVVVVGSEGTGMRPLIRRECDFLVGVPMRGRIGSLNVSVAAGIFLYELVRQEKVSATEGETKGARL
ncbi:MAG TPA: 23S rRNA (guanosine(2251)-2'-O)-methyltransferase RlmB [Candidatus Acidoferrales bacterium]|nr:23S rRNA (guanosine(2251)-2'-O)-methyltransferase RlmB [Candidatus Acidoferrales bacterium]